MHASLLRHYHLHILHRLPKVSWMFSNESMVSGLCSVKWARFIQTIFTIHGIIQWRCICFNVWTSVVHMDSGMQLALRNAASMQHKIGQLENSWTKSPSMWESCAACMSLARCVLTIRWAFQSVSVPLPWCIIIYTTYMYRWAIMVWQLTVIISSMPSLQFHLLHYKVYVVYKRRIPMPGLERAGVARV